MKKPSVFSAWAFPTVLSEGLAGASDLARGLGARHLTSLKVAYFPYLD